MKLAGPFCSIVIPTIGRSTLGRAVQSVLAQDFAHEEIQVVVVNDSGSALQPQEWQMSPCVQVITTQRRRQVTARNAGAAIAKGQYLLFLDDDDWLLPGALSYFWSQAKVHPEAGCLFGSFELVDDDGCVLSRHDLCANGNVAVQLITGRWIQLASVMVRRDVFFAAGGLSPLFRISEELDLFGRIAVCEDFAGTDTVVAHIHRGTSWQTSVDYSDVYEYNRLARDRALSMPCALQRLRQSAGASCYWHGRVVRVYGVAALWNLRRRKSITTALSRGLFGFWSFSAAWRCMFSEDFWLALGQDLPDR